MIKKLFILFIVLFFISFQWYDLNSKSDIEPIEEIPIVEVPIIEEETKWIIVIDPGHGPLVNNELEPIAPNSSIMKRKYGIGAVGNYTGTMEREINLKVSLVLRDLLEEAGYTVIMTRTNHDVVLSNIERVNLANENNADMMIRIHSDSYKDPKIHGASVLVPGDVGYAIDIVEISRKYGEIILNTLVKEVGMSNRGVITREDQTGFNWSKVPIMTVEMGFLSNPDEDKLLSSSEYQYKLANALYKGIIKCLPMKN